MESYGPLSTEVYDLTKPAPPDFVLDFFLEQAAGLGPVLSPMCGSGRFMLPFLERGIDIDGADASPSMLDACRRRCAAAGHSPWLGSQFLHELAPPRQYGCIFIPGASIGLITDERMLQTALARMQAALQPGGKLLLEFETPFARPAVMNRWFGYWVEREDGARIVMSNMDRSYDEEKQILETAVKYELVKAGQLIQTEYEFMSTRFFKPETFAAMLADAGFAEVAIWQAQGGFAQQPPRPEDPRAVAVAFRPG